MHIQQNTVMQPLHFIWAWTQHCIQWLQFEQELNPDILQGRQETYHLATNTHNGQNFINVGNPEKKNRKTVIKHGLLSKVISISYWCII